MYHKAWLVLFALVVLVSCVPRSPQKTGPTPKMQMANPASVYCERNGGKLEIRRPASGGEYGVCVFPDGSECEEWAYFRGECKPRSAQPTPVPTAPPERTELAPTATVEVAGNNGWKIYRNEKLGYRFDYPADANLIPNDDSLGGLSIIGPLVGAEHWPVFYIAHPADREEYRLPQGADLAKWLTDHHLLGDERQPDVQIAGTTAIHTRHKRSPQSFADDRYYFAKSGQLYVIVIIHAGDKEDWALYNRFLGSFQFER